MKEAVAVAAAAAAAAATAAAAAEAAACRWAGGACGIASGWNGSK